MSKSLSVLIVEDFMSDAILLEKELRRGGYEIDSRVVDNGRDLQDALQQHNWDIILSDYTLPGFDAPTALKIVKEHHSNIPFIIISGTVGEDVAVQAMKAGAQDFFAKDKLTRLVPAVERELREAQLRRDRQLAERMAQATLDALSAHIAILDETGTIVSANQAWFDFAKNNGVENWDRAFIGTNYLEICDKTLDSDNGVAQFVASAIRAVIDGAQNFAEIDYPCNSPTEKRWFTVRITRFHGEDPLRIVVAHENVSQHKFAEEQITLAKDLISLLSDIAATSNTATSVDDILSFTLQRICTFTGCEIGHAYLIPSGDILQLDSTTIWHIDDTSNFVEFKTFTDTLFEPTQKSVIRDVAHAQEQVWMEDVSSNADFVRAEIAAKCGLKFGFAFPIRTQDKVVGILEFFTTQSMNDTLREILDSTAQIGTQIGQVIERHEAQQALRESEIRYRALFDHSLNAVYVHDFEGNFIDGNPAALALLGFTADDITQLNFFDLMPPNELAKALEVVQEIGNIGYQQNPLEIQLLRKDKSEIYVETISSVIYKNDEPWAIQGIARDITAQKAAHDEEQTRRIFAEALNLTTSMVLSDDFDRIKVLDVILEYATVLIPCDAATLMNVKSGIATVICHQGYSGAALEGIQSIALEVDNTSHLNHMAQTSSPFIIDDTETYIGWQVDKVPKGATIRSTLGSPIFIGDQLFGFLNLDSITRNHFTQNHADQLSLLCNQAALALHSAEQYEQKKRYAQRLEILHEIDKAILRADHPQEIATIVLQNLKTLTHYHSASVTMYDVGKQKETSLASTDLLTDWFNSHETHDINHDQLISELQENNVYIVDDLMQKQSLSWLEEQLVAIGIQSYACIAMTIGDSLVGSLDFYFQDKYVLSSEELNIAHEIAALLAIAIENSRLLEVEMRRNSELTAIHQASLQLTSTFDLDTVLHTIIDYAILLINAYDAHIFLYDGETLAFGAAQQDGERHSKPFVELEPDGLTYTVAQSGKRKIIKNLATQTVSQDSLHRGAVIGLPLTVADTVRGVMSLAFIHDHDFDEHEIRLLELLADQAAIAIHNAQLYQQIQTHASGLEQRVIKRTQELQYAKDRGESILNASNDALILVNEAGDIYQTNPGLNSQFQYRSDDLTGKALDKLIVPESVEQFQATFKTVVEDKVSLRVEIIAQRHDKSTFPVDVLLAPIVEAGNVDVVCSLRDITLQKRVEQELREALEREKELNELKTQFTSIVSHEFRTPLAVILSSSDLLLKYADRLSPEKQQSKLLQISRQVQRLTQLMDDILMITQSQSVGFDFKPHHTNLFELCERIIEEVQVRNQAEIPIILTYEGNCSDVIIDEFLFTHILQNLGSNAVKYSKSIGQVFIYLSCTTRQIVLKVEDNGIGIPEDHQSKLFESFQRASNVGQIQGTGVGMTIVKQAVDAHKGTIEFTSMENEGTTFIVTLPNQKIKEVRHD